MRTTLTLEPDVERKLKRVMSARKISLKQAVNEGLRHGLLEAAPVRKKFVVEPHSFGFRPGIDFDRMNQLADELETEEILRKMNL